MAGAKGERGPTGERGLPGVAGKDGKSGKDGRPGAKGEPGLNGKDGKDGKPGAQGPSGVKGERGPAGSKGERGPAGADGKDGKNGKDGVKGDRGPAGPVGPAGPAGESSDSRSTGFRQITTLLDAPAGAGIEHAILRRVGNTVEFAISGLRSRKRLKAVLGKVPDGFRPCHHQSLVTSDNEFHHVRFEVGAKRSPTISVQQPPSADGLSEVSTSIVWLTDDKWPAKLPGKEWSR